jgi:integrase
VERWKADFIAKAEKNPVAAQRARRSVNSYIRNARALFSRKILKRLSELSLPAPAMPFQGVTLERQGSTRYVSTVNAGRLLTAARKDLKEKDPEAWKVILLAMGAGLRRAEIDGLCWSQIDPDNSEIRILNHAHFETKTDESTGAVFVDAGLLAELKQLRKGTGLFVVESETPAMTRKGQCYRCAESFAGATTWLRANGVMTQKPLHTLRKEFGSLICAQSDIHTASRQLRHSTISTTAAYYADHRRRETVNIGEMLKEAKAQ